MHRAILRLLWAFPAVTGLAALAVAGALVATPAPAAAATKGAGVPGLTPYGGYLGNYLAPDGSYTYCIDSSLSWPSGPTLVDSLTTTWGATVPPETLRKLNYVLLHYGQTDDGVQAAAVAAYVNAYTSGWARDLGPGYEAGAWYLNGNVMVTNVYDGLWAEAEGNAEPSGTASVAVEMADSTRGTVVVSSTRPDATGILQLDGAVSATTGEAEVEVLPDEEVEIRGTPAEGELQYAIAAEVSYSVPAPEASLRPYTTPDQQRTVSGGMPGTVAFAAAARTGPLEARPRQVVIAAGTPTLAATGGSPDALALGGAALLFLGALLGISARSRRWLSRE